MKPQLLGIKPNEVKILSGRLRGTSQVCGSMGGVFENPLVLTAIRKTLRGFYENFNKGVMQEFTVKKIGSISTENSGERYLALSKLFQDERMYAFFLERLLDIAMLMPMEWKNSLKADQLISLLVATETFRAHVKGEGIPKSIEDLGKIFDIDLGDNIPWTKIIKGHSNPNASVLARKVLAAIKDNSTHIGIDITKNGIKLEIHEPTITKQ